MANSLSSAIAEGDSKQDINVNAKVTFETFKEAKVSQWVIIFATFLRFQFRLTGKLLAKL